MQEKVYEALKDLGWDKNQISDIQENSGTLTVCLEINPEEGPVIEDKRQSAERALAQISGVQSAHVILTAERNTPPDTPKPQTRKPPVQENLKPPQIKHIVAVASGKGGVGKSTTAVGLARALALSGLKIGIMDADIYGPSIPKMMGLEESKAAMNENKKLDVFNAKDIACMSIGFLVDVDQPMIWRGPMVQSAIRQFLIDVDWPELDVLIVDMPPGTGDAQLTMAQKVPLSGAVIVSTPQDIALIDAKKGIEMFRQTNVPILGLIENMSLFCCPNCGHETPIFGAGGAQQVASELDIPFLGAIPLEPKIREQGDHPAHYDIAYFAEIAETIKRSL